MTNRGKLKKALSLVMTLVMVLTMLPALTAGLYNQALAADTKPASTTIGDLKFFVPEVIYLTPDGRSWSTSTSSPFQFYVNNDSNGNVKREAAETTGYIYYNFSGASTATVTGQFYNQNMSGTLSGGSISVSNNGTVSSGGNVTISGTSPSLAASTTGCYVRWELSYHDSNDNKDKKAYAWSYVYKPYVVPVAAGALSGSGTSGGANYSGQFTWLSGVHSLIVDGMPDYSYSDSLDSYEANNYLKFGEFHAFISSSASARVNNTATSSNGYSGVALGSWSGHDSSKKGDVRYLVYGNNTGSNKSYAYVLVEGNRSPTSYNNSGSDTSVNFGIKNTTFAKRQDNNKNTVCKCVAKTIGNIIIDTSRYTNLNQIPNLAVGLLVTSDENSGDNSGHWYMADVSDISWGHRSTWYDKEDEQKTYYNEKDYIFAGQTSGYHSSGWNETEGLRYAGGWYRTLLNTGNADQMYYVKGMYGNKDGSYYSQGMGYVGLKATYNNKANLRAAVQNAIKQMAKLGVNGDSNGNITSLYFDANNSNYKWGDLQTAYKNAVMALTRVDASYTNCESLASALNNALANLQTKVSFNGNGGTLNGVSDVYVKIGTNHSVQFQPDSYLGSYSGSRTGYSLKTADMRWSTNASAENGSSAVTVGYNQTVYAIWTPNTYNVGFNKNGGTGTMSAQSFNYDEEKALSANEFVRKNTLTLNYSYTGSTNDTLDANYTFDGWDGENFVNDTGTYTETGSGSYTEIRQYDVAVPYDGFKQGDRYVFEFDAKGSGALTTYFYGAGNYKKVASGVCSNGVTSTSTDGNVGIALTADYQHYKVTYTLGSAGDGNQVKYLLLRVFPGNTATVTNIRAHRVFADQETVKNLNDSGNYQLTARWLDPGAITLPGATRNGYTFDGWYNASTGNDKYGDEGDSVTLTGNKTVYAHWTEATYTITYKEGTTTTTQNYTYNTTNNAYQLKTSTPPTGYDFNGWKVTETGGNWFAVGTILAAGASTKNTYGNVTLEAQYSPKSYTAEVTIGTGGTISGAPTTVNYDDTYTFNVTLSGGYDTETPQVYTENCSCTLNGSGNSYTATISNVMNSNTVNSNPNVYVHITPKPTQYTVSVNAGDGIGTNTELSTLKVDYNGTATLVVTLDEAYENLVARNGATTLNPSIEGNTYTYTIPNVQSNITIDLTATHKSYTVTLNESAAATYDQTSPQRVYYGEDFTFTVTMKAGYTQNLPTVLVNGVELTKISGSNGVYTYKIDNIKENKQVVVTGTLNTYSVQVNIDDGLEAVANTTVTHGNNYTLTLTLKDGYTNTAPTAKIGDTPITLTKQSGSDKVYTGSITVTDNITIDATSTINTYSVNISGDAGATLSDASFTNVEHNSNISFTVTLNEGYTQNAPVVKNGDNVIPYSSVDGYKYTYSFAVTADMEISVTTKLNKYTIRFVTPNGTEIWSTEVDHGDTPAYGGDNLATTSDDDQHYVFTNEWTPEFVPATENATYKLVVTGEDHDWNEGEVTTPAMCVTPGVKTYTCRVCKRTRTEEIDPIGHHTWNAGEVTTPPTCTEAGVKTFTCTVVGCGATYTEPVTKLGHRYGAWVPYSDTHHAHYCANDNSHFETAAHRWDEGVYSEGFSCESGGYKTYTCQDCGATRTETYSAGQAHQFGPWVTLFEGDKDHDTIQRRTCVNCGAIQEKVTPYTGSDTNPSGNLVQSFNLFDLLKNFIMKIINFFQQMRF